MLSSKNVEDIAKYINDYISYNYTCKLRIVYSKTDEKIAVLKQYFSNRKDIVFKADDKLRELRNTTQESDEFYNKYGFISQSNMSPEQKLVQYINTNMGKDYITFEELEYLLKEE